jgi:hypothetical protein
MKVKTFKIVEVKIYFTGDGKLTVGVDMLLMKSCSLKNQFFPGVQCVVVNFGGLTITHHLRIIGFDKQDVQMLLS